MFTLAPQSAKTQVSCLVSHRCDCSIIGFIILNSPTPTFSNHSPLKVNIANAKAYNFCIIYQTQTSTSSSIFLTFSNVCNMNIFIFHSEFFKSTHFHVCDRDGYHQFTASIGNKFLKLVMVTWSETNATFHNHEVPIFKLRFLRLNTHLFCSMKYLLTSFQ